MAEPVAVPVTARRRLRAILAGDACEAAAPVFDPLSARLAHAQGWRLCKLSGSAAKAAALALPDAVSLAGSSDLADLTRRVVRAADTVLVVDADDGGGTELAIRRTVEDLEVAGAAAVEIEDVAVPATFGPDRAASPRYVATHAVHFAQLRAAVDARRDPETVIVARTHALRRLPRHEALARIAGFAATGAEAVMLPGLPHGRADLEAVREVTDLPLCVLGLPADLASDEELLRAANVKVRFLGLGVYRIAVQAIAGALDRLRRGEDLDGVGDEYASAELLRTVSRDDELSSWEAEHRIAGGGAAPGDAGSGDAAWDHAAWGPYLRGDHGR